MSSSVSVACGSGCMMNWSSSVTRWCASSGRWVMAGVAIWLRSSVIDAQRRSLSVSMPCPVTADMNTWGRSSGSVVCMA